MADRPVAERVLDAATRITCDSGWGHVTMAKVAGLAGVSRQTVYNEYGAKPALGQAMVLRELDRFLTVVAHELDSHDDLVAGIRAAARSTLALAQDNPLLHAVLASAHSVSAGSGPGSDNDLLPFLTTDAGPLIAAAKEVILARLDRFPGVGLSAEELDGSVDAIVRLVLSHVMQPGDSPDRTADRLAFIAGRVLRD
ncbi:MAG: TetR family transcriptional regulator [Nocardioidaceae bacterium]|nr:TetR family transcriptional regulator [Nocardioidaceae bacterium]NUS49615.1 TetR family transcriptional regulator [Nocardioidaceae bacterium]